MQDLEISFEKEIQGIYLDTMYIFICKNWELQLEAERNAQRASPAPTLITMASPAKKKGVVEVPVGLARRDLWIKAHEEFFQPFMDEAFFKKLDQNVKKANPPSMFWGINSYF